jgi:hypothetical protein
MRLFARFVVSATYVAVRCYREEALCTHENAAIHGGRFGAGQMFRNFKISP